MSSDWPLYKFDEVADFSSHRTSANNIDQESYISTENMVENFGGVVRAASIPLNGSVNLYFEGDTLFSNIRTYFKKVWFANRDGTCSPDVLVIRPKHEHIDSKYLNLVCRSPSFIEFSIRTSKGAKMPRGDKAALAQFEVKLPPPAIQLQIGKTISDLDEKIELNNQINQTLETMAQAIFKSWFVDFEPVKAKMAVLQAGGSQAEAEQAAMMAISGKTAEQLSTMRTTQAEAYQQLTQTAALFPVAMQESELGEIPEGWASGSLASIMDIAGGTQPPANEFLDKPSDGYVRLIQIRDYETDAHLTFVKDTNKLRKTSIKDVMIARYGASVGRICWGLEGAYNVALVRVVCEPYFTEFLRSYLSTDNFQTRLAQMSGRSAQAGFNKSDIASFNLVIPKNTIAIEYEKIAWSLREPILRSKKENAQLELVRDSLLPKLLSGEIDLSAIDEVAA